MSGSRPGDPMSERSERWLQEVRANVKAQLFGPPATAKPKPTKTPPPPPPQPTDEPEDEEPTRIGRFVVIKRIGEGGMGMVYAAYDDALDRKVAVKLLHPRGSGSGTDARARLIREAQALARLSHPSVIHVYEVGTWQDQVYVAMEFVDGTTLQRWQQQEGRTWREVLEAYVAAGRGLAAAHAAGIVHRDFKAANVLVRNDGAVRVVDFGLARQQIEATTRAEQERPAGSAPALALVGDEASASASDLPLTRTGVIMGTPAYMAPEQHLGQRAEPRCDQFSYCVSLYEALYGFRPFAGQTMGALRRNVLAGRLEQPPRYTDIPPRIFRVLERGLSVHAGDRYPAMAGLLDDLTRDPRVTLRRIAFGLGVLLLLGVIALLWWSEQERREARAEGQRLRDQFEQARMQHAEQQVRRAQSRTRSERWDDLVLAFARESLDKNPTRALAALKHLTPQNEGWLNAARTIAADALQRGVVHQQVPTDFERIVRVEFVRPRNRLVVAGSGLALVDPLTGRVQRLAAPEAGLRDMNASNTGHRIVAIGRDNAIHQWTRGKGDDYELRTLPSPEGPLTAVALADDGSRIAVGGSDGAVHLLAWSGRRIRTLRDHRQPIRALAFSSDGTLLASASDDGVIRQWFLGDNTHWTFEQTYNIFDVGFSGDGATLWSTSDDGRIRQWSATQGRRVADHDRNNVRLFAHNPSGQRLLLAQRDGTLAVVRDDEDPQPLLGPTQTATTIDVSDDGIWAAVATTDQQLRLWRLTGMGGDDTEPDGSQVVSRRSLMTALAFSDDGNLLASATRQGIVELWSQRGEPRGRLGQHGRTVFDLGFSPQGHELAAHDEQGGLVVWSVADPELEPVIVRTEGPRHPGGWVWSPDGEAIAATDCRGGTTCSVILYPLREEPQVLGGVDSPATTLLFSPSGRYLLSDHPTGAWIWDRYEGSGRALTWPSEPNIGKRIAFAHVRGGMRIATAHVQRDADAQVVSTTLRVWHVGPQDGELHLLFEEPDLRTLLVDPTRQTLLLQAEPESAVVWSLSDDRFLQIPGVDPEHDGMLVAPDQSAVLLIAHNRHGRELDSTWLDIESGQRRRFSRRQKPVAWSASGVVADMHGRRGLRLWSDPTPDQPDEFIAWLEETTNVSVASGSIH